LNAGQENKTDMTDSFRLVDHEVARKYLALFAKLGAVDRIQGITSAVDLIYGEHTYTAVRRSVDQFCAVLPQALRTEIAGARHLPLTENTRDLAQAIFIPIGQGSAPAGPTENSYSPALG
jgi:hypothetical protein